MLKKIKGRPVWYKIWMLTVVVATLIALFGIVDYMFLSEQGEGLKKWYFGWMAYVHLSILAELYLFPDKEKEEAQA